MFHRNPDFQPGYKLLLLITNPGKVFSREELLEIIWGYEYFGDLRTVDVHVENVIHN